MNIESVSVSPLAANSGSVESISPPLSDGAVSEGFSGALIAQIGLLSDIKTEGLLPMQMPAPAVSQVVNGPQSAADLAVGAVAVQDFAALLGNDLPSSYKTKGDIDHEAALAAVTDTLKYITAGTTAGEKAAEAEKNMKDVIAMALPSEQGKMAAGVEAGQSSAAQTVEAAQTTAALIAESEQNKAALAAEAELNKAADAEAKQNIGVAIAGAQDMKNAVVADSQAQMDLKQASDKYDKKRIEDQVQARTDAGDNSGALDLLAAMILPAASPVGQGTAVNNFAPADTLKADTQLSFIKPSTGDAKPNLYAKTPDSALSGAAVSGQSAQDNQGANLKYFESAGLVEKAGRAEQQTLNLEGEKTLSRVGADITALGRSAVDSKADVPAITKPLTHPEWNKDLGERIVWMSSKAIPSAEIRLNPEHLGPISVRVNVTDDQATVSFTAQHAATREALEASVPKLREMMGSQQLNLAEVSVFQGAASDQGRSQAQNFGQTADGQGQQGAAGAVIEGVDDVEQEIESGRAVVSKGLLSLYA